MTLPDDLVKQVTRALMADHEWDTIARASREVAQQLAEKDARIAVAAVLRALPESETVIAAARRAAVAKHGTLIGSLPEVLADAILAAIAKLADDV